MSTLSRIPPTGLADLSARLAELPARFHLPLTPPPGAVTLADLHDPAICAQLLDAHAAARGIPNHAFGRVSLPGQISASLTVQGIAMHLLGAVLAGVVHHRALITTAAEDVHIAAMGPMFAVAASAGEVMTAATPAELLEPFAEHWIDGHARRLVEDVRAVRRVGEALLWGNVASAVAATFVFFDWWDASVGNRALADQVLMLGTPRLGASAWLAPLEVDGRVGLRSERSACCLLAKVPDTHVCPTCPLSTVEQRMRTTEQHVRHLFAVQRGEASGPPPWARRG